MSASPLSLVLPRDPERAVSLEVGPADVVAAVRCPDDQGIRGQATDTRVRYRSSRSSEPTRRVLTRQLDQLRRQRRPRNQALQRIPLGSSPIWSVTPFARSPELGDVREAWRAVRVAPSVAQFSPFKLYSAFEIGRAPCAASDSRAIALAFWPRPTTETVCTNASWPPMFALPNAPTSRGAPSAAFAGAAPRSKDAIKAPIKRIPSLCMSGLQVPRAVTCSHL